MSNQQKIEKLETSLKEAEHVQAELDRRVFHLKTLYDVSKDIYGSVDTETILRNFLLMTTGNFGVVEGLVTLMDIPSNAINHFVSIGMPDRDVSDLKDCLNRLLVQDGLKGWPECILDIEQSGFLSGRIGFSLPFSVDSDCSGILGLGAKLVKEPYTEQDRELLDTLINNLVVALKNARSFEEIKDLNEELQAKNIQLEKTLDDLKKALRKVEILEDVKSNLSKFVPNTVTRLIEKSPKGVIPESREQDVSVLFVDIEGYTKMCEQLDRADVNEVIEKCFSVFMDAIFANNGDVNETAGDGLMVVFLNSEKSINAQEAVSTALKIREEAARIKNEFKGLSEPLTINMGITGSRWTYTARGLVTNVAARIGAQATNGKVFLSKATADRVKDQFPLSPLGRFSLKNVSEEVEIFEV
jgi:class 3 adenylate cyclase